MRLKFKKLLLLTTFSTVGLFFNVFAISKTPTNTTPAQTATNTISEATATESTNNIIMIPSLKFDENLPHSTSSFTQNGQKFTYRSYENIAYATKPINAEYQTINIYIPENYFLNKKVHTYTAKTAPIFLPNSIGGYMPSKAATINDSRNGETIKQALARGYVVAAPGARGRTLTTKNGEFSGKAPAGIIDLQAAVAYLHANDSTMPGNADRIISNGTSAGGAYSLLLGVAGNSTDMKAYLNDIGVAKARTDIFAVSAYCPILNLDNADTAYEWSYNDVTIYTEGNKMAGGLPLAQMNNSNPLSTNKASSKTQTTSTKKIISLTPEQIQYSNNLKRQFPAYINSLELKTPNGDKLYLDNDGNGSFMDYAKSFIIKSAEKAKSTGIDITSAKYLIFDKNDTNKIIDVDWTAYNTAVGRMKTPGAFDARDNSTGENNEFGNSTTDNMHFTERVMPYATDKRPQKANQQIVNMMNPMYYLGNPSATNANYYRIRYGEHDNNTSMAIPLIAAIKAQNLGYAVDFEMPWNVGHSGDYDLDELFDWIDKIVISKK